MPFPHCAQAPFESQNCSVGRPKERTDLLSRISELANVLERDARLKLPETRPARAAAIIYLGLCRLRHACDNGEFEKWQQHCHDLNARLLPGETGGHSINVSYFRGGEKNFRNHIRAIKGATGIFIPDVKSMKKRCLILTAVGVDHDESILVPDDDSWVDDYVFRIPRN